jgi:DNA-binding transcriptional regulator YiaG
MRYRRHERGLTQAQVGTILGVTECCVTNWELGHTEPEVRYFPKIIEFIGYCPYDPCADLIDRAGAIRRAFGLTQEGLALILDVDESSLASWERQEHKPTKRSRERLRSFIANPLGPVLR